MSRAAQMFRQTDLMKTIKAARKAGIVVERYELERGKITIVPVAAVAPAAPMPVDVAADAMG